MADHSIPPYLRLHADDNVLLARRKIPAGTEMVVEHAGETVCVTAAETIELGHKVAWRPIAQGEAITKFGQTIGYAVAPIDAGQWVHVHNIECGTLALDYRFASEIPPDPPTPEPRTFMGYRRANGKAGTRNYIGILSTVNCSATTAKYVAERLSKTVLDRYPNVDGIVPLIHKGGCAFKFRGDDHLRLARVMSGFANHPNIGGYIILGLGCETAQGSFLVDEHQLVTLQNPDQADNPAPPLVMNIQEIGGVAKTVDRAAAALEEMLPEVNRVERTPIPVSELILACECGGSDGNSGVTANPALGVASDLLVAHGGTSIVSETTEIYGAEHMLTRRAKSREVGEKLVGLIHWWEKYAALFGQTIDNNPSIGNKNGGLTTIFEKSLGAIAKAGQSALCEVYQYAEPVTQKGFVFMDSPGFDPASVTGMVAGGAQIVVFTTGRGSCFGCKPSPTIKVTTNSPIYHRMIDDMDINAGRILEGESVESLGAEIFEEIIAVASGKQTKSERQGIGDEEFCPWTFGPVL